MADLWRKIETLNVAELADGAEMLIHNDRGTFVGAWEPDWSPQHGFHGGWWMISDGKDIERALRGGTPTHWQPVPDPPGKARCTYCDGAKRGCSYCNGTGLEEPAGGGGDE